MKKTAIFALIFVVMAGLVFAQDFKAKVIICNLGRASLSSQPINNLDDVANLIEENFQNNNIQKAFLSAGYFFLLQDFVNQFYRGLEVESVIVQRGQKIYFMIYRGGKILQQAEWKGIEGKREFEAFKFSIVCQKKSYTFLIPKVCGNLSLIGIGKAPEPVVKQVKKEPEVRKEEKPKQEPRYEEERLISFDTHPREKSERKFFPEIFFGGGIVRGTYTVYAPIIIAGLEYRLLRGFAIGAEMGLANPCNKDDHWLAFCFQEGFFRVFGEKAFLKISAGYVGRQREDRPVYNYLGAELGIGILKECFFSIGARGGVKDLAERHQFYAGIRYFF